MPNYQIRSRALVDLINEIRTGRLILSPYFQRELVWREMHKRDFITTIMLGYPFPQIFVSRGSIDVERMVATSQIVDGQQRMSTIREFVDNRLDVSGRYFRNLSPEEKETFLKYEVPVIDLDLSDNDPQIKEIFKRLNRTFYSLTEIEKLSSENSTSDLMLVAKLLTKQINEPIVDDDADFREDVSSEADEHVPPEQFLRRASDPNIPPGFWAWAREQPLQHMRQLLLESSVFTTYEISRQVHLIFILNVLSTIIGDGFFSRNSKTREFLDEYKESVPEKDDIVRKLDEAASKIIDMALPPTSYWNNKANAFSLLICLYRHAEKLTSLEPNDMRERLEAFARQIPRDYQLVATEAVNRKRERVIRNRYLNNLIFSEGVEEGEV